MRTCKRSLERLHISVPQRVRGEHFQLTRAQDAPFVAGHWPARIEKRRAVSGIWDFDRHACAFSGNLGKVIR